MCVEQENNKLFLNHCSVSRRHVSKNSHYLRWPLAKTCLSWHVLAFVCLGKCLQTEEWIKKLYMYIHSRILLLLLLLSRFSRVPLCATPETAAHQAPLSLGFSRQEHWSGLPFASPMHKSEKWKQSPSVVSDSLWSRGLQPARLLHPWDFPGKSTTQS